MIVLASAVPILSTVPATFYGFASTFAYLSLVPGAFTIKTMTAFNWENVIVAMPISLLIGSCLGIAHGWLSQVLLAGDTATARNIRLDGSMVRRFYTAMVDNYGQSIGTGCSFAS